MLKIEISGLDTLQRELEDAQLAFMALDGNIATVRFTASDQQSIDAAIQAMEAAIDEKAAPYRGNRLVESIIPQMKAKYRAAILERAK